MRWEEFVQIKYMSDPRPCELPYERLPSGSTQHTFNRAGMRCSPRAAANRKRASQYARV